MNGEFITKYDEDQPRDEAGRFSSNGGGGDNRTYSEVVRERNLIEEQVALRAYTSYDFLSINTALRNDKAEVQGTTITALDRLIATQPPLTESVTVYRGVVGSIAEELSQLEEGDTFTDKAYSSTSLQESVAEHFGSTGGFRDYDTPTLKLSITIPEGSRVLNVDSYSAANGLTERQESEFLLPRGSTFEVQGFDEDNDVLYVGFVND